MKGIVLSILFLSLIINCQAQFYYKGPKKDFYTLSDLEFAPHLDNNSGDMGFLLAHNIFKLIEDGLSEPWTYNNHSYKKDEIKYFYRTFSPTTHASSNPQFGESNIVPYGIYLDSSYNQFTAQLYFDANQQLIVNDSIEIIFHKQAELSTKMIDPISMVFPVSDEIKKELSKYRLTDEPRLLVTEANRSKAYTVPFTAPIDFLKEKSRFGSPTIDAECYVKIKKGNPILNIQIINSHISEAEVKSLITNYLGQQENIEAFQKTKLLLIHEQYFIGIRYHKHYDIGPKKFGDYVAIHKVEKE